MLYFLLYVVLSLPLWFSFYFAYDKDWLALLGAALALLLIAGAVLGLAWHFKRRFWRFLLAMPMLLLLFGFELAQLVSFYLQGVGFNQQFFYHFNLALLRESVGLYPLLTAALVILLLLLAAGIYAVLCRPWRRLPLFALLLLLFLGLNLDAAWRNFLTAYRLSFQPLDEVAIVDFERFGLNPKAIDQALLPAKAGKNLLLIYLESLEQIYLDEALFPGLTPNLQRFAVEGLRFDNLSAALGTGWTIAGMVSSQCGTPLLYQMQMGGNDVMQQGFLSKAVCLGDILHQAGYKQVFMGGASPKFAGKGLFLSSHHYDEVLGWEALLPQIADEAYHNDWGLFDDSLFDLAAAKFEHLAEADRPFNLTLLSVDTHHPVGHASRSCRPYTVDNSILAAVHCTDQLLDRFLSRIAKHPAYADTVVVLFSDHLAMRNDADGFYPDDYDRKLFLTLLNTGQSGRVTTAGLHTDVAPTVLATLGVEHQQQFLIGKNLLESAVSRSEKMPYQALAYVNSHYLSAQKSANICQGDYWLNGQAGDDKSVYFGSQKLPLSFGGKLFSKAEWPVNLMLLVVLDQEGEILRSMVIDRLSLAYHLRRYPQAVFLLLAFSQALPVPWRSDVSLDKPFKVLLLSSMRKPMYLGHFADLPQVHLSHNSCLEQLQQTFRESLLPSFDYANLCQHDDDVVAHYDIKTQILSVPYVLVNGALHKAQLRLLDNHIFRVEKLLPLASESLSAGQCVSYFSGVSLDILAVDVLGQRRALQMSLVNANPIEFALSDAGAIWFEPFRQ